MYVTLNICMFVLYWYHLYLKHPTGEIFDNKIRQICYCNDIVAQAGPSLNKGKLCQQLNNSKKCYIHIPPKKITYLRQ